MANCSASSVSNLNDPDAHGPDGRVIDGARVAWDDDFVFREAGEVGYSYVQVRIPARDAGSRRVRNGGGTTRAHEAPFSAGQLGEPLTGGCHELVHLHVQLVREALRFPDFRQLDGAADHGDGPPAVDQGPNTQRSVQVMGAARDRHGLHP